MKCYYFGSPIPTRHGRKSKLTLRSVQNTRLCTFVYLPTLCYVWLLNRCTSLRLHIRPQPVTSLVRSVRLGGIATPSRAQCYRRGERITVTVQQFSAFS